MSLVIPARLCDVRRALADVMAGLEGEGVGCLDRATAELVLAEVLNNVVEHAYAAPVPPVPSRPGQSCAGPCDRPCSGRLGHDSKNWRGETIRVGLALTPESLDIRVEDLGRAMPGRVVPAGEMPPAGGPAGMLPEGGWGWGMICGLTENLHYCRAPGRNVLRFRLPLAGE